MHVEMLQDLRELWSLSVADHADENLVRSSSLLTAAVPLFIELSASDLWLGPLDHNGIAHLALEVVSGSGQAWHMG